MAGIRSCIDPPSVPLTVFIAFCFPLVLHALGFEFLKKSSSSQVGVGTDASPASVVVVSPSAKVAVF